MKIVLDGTISLAEPVDQKRVVVCSLDIVEWIVVSNAPSPHTMKEKGSPQSPTASRHMMQVLKRRLASLRAERGEERVSVVPDSSRDSWQLECKS